MYCRRFGLINWRWLRCCDRIAEKNLGEAIAAMDRSPASLSHDLWLEEHLVWQEIGFCLFDRWLCSQPQQKKGRMAPGVIWVCRVVVLCQ